MAAETLTNQDVLKMSQAGLGTSVIVAKIQVSETAFDTGVDTLVTVAEKGVHSAVLKAMVDADRTRQTEAPETAAGTDTREPAQGTSSATEAEPPARPGSTFREPLRSGGEGPDGRCLCGAFQNGLPD